MKKVVLLFTICFGMVLNTFAHDFEAVNSDGKTIYYNKNSDSTIAVTYGGNNPDDMVGELRYTGVINIPESVIYNNTTYSVTSIGEFAFRYCSGLTGVTIPNSVTSIGEFAFAYCSELTSIAIPNLVTSIGDYAFYNCGITSIEIPILVTSIGKAVFCGCDLTSIQIPNSVTSIGYHAFADCSELTNVTIPNSVTSIGESVFEDCENLASIDVDENNQYYSSIDGVLFDKQQDTLICYPIGKAGISYEIPNGVKCIKARAFCDSRLREVTTPNSVVKLEEKAFTGSQLLKKLIIGQSVAEIGNDAFYGLIRLDTMICKAAVPPTIEENTFEYYNVDVVLVVPCGKVDVYRNAQYWGQCIDFIIEDCTGLNDAEENANITLYPNPTSGNATLSIEGLNEDMQVLVCDMQGKVVYSTQASQGDNNIMLETSNLSAGVYYVRVLTANTTSTSKLIKK